MGQIIDTKNGANNSVICKILLDNKEVESLRGHMKNIGQLISQKIEDYSKVFYIYTLKKEEEN